MSTIASQPSRLAKVMQSPSTSRPSASALFISTVVPSSAVRMSPARMAAPLIMFSVAPITASTLTGASSSASAAIVSITAAPPAMSNFMSTWPAGGLMARPPLSNVTALPISASRRSLSARTGHSSARSASPDPRRIPAATAANAPIPAGASLRRRAR